MRSDRDVKGLNVGKNSKGSLRTGRKIVEMDTLRFKTTKKVLSNSIIIGIIGTAHTGVAAKVEQLIPIGSTGTGILNAQSL